MVKTILSLSEEYLADNRRIKFSTHKLTELSFQYMIKAVGNIEIRRLTMEHAEIYQTWLLNRYARTTVNTYMKVLRSVFNWARRRKLVSEDIFAVPPVKVTEERQRVYEPQEIERMLEVARPIWGLRILLAKTCGLRRTEILNLTYSDVDFQRMLIHVQPKKDTHITWSWEPKNRKCRELPITDGIAQRIIDQRQRILPGQPYFCLSERRYSTLKRKLIDGELDERSRYCPDENFTNPFQSLLVKANVPHGTFHDLRRTYGTEMAEAGIPQHELAELMGHANSKTTEKFYIRIRRRQMIERARVIVNNVVYS